MNKKQLVLISSILCAFTFIVWGVLQNQSTSVPYDAEYSYSPDIPLLGSRSSGAYESGGKFNRDINTVDYTSVQFLPWDVESASAKISEQEKKAYTIMIYMNGSDLESENGAATDDIIEILDSGVNTSLINVLLFTGGTQRWQNDVIPENDCTIWKLTEGCLEELTGVGLVNMGNPGTLSSFIKFSVNSFPADKYGLILWDHGGGSIAGYGHDEKFNNSSLTLLDMDYAFKMGGLHNNKLEFLGFDSCLMATVEMAVVASAYADYLVASEDLEPGDGWNYHFLSVLNNEPYMNGANIGAAITDYFMDYYGNDTDEFLTMSVTDLKKAGMVMDAMGRLMNQCSAGLLADSRPSFATFARKRFGTKTFGEGSPRDNDCDMVDLGDMAYRLSDIFPYEAAAVLSALDEAVVYNRHNSDADLRGLSAYYIYGGRAQAHISLPTYASLQMSMDYTDYLYYFAGMLNSERGVRRSSRSLASQAGNGDYLPSGEELAGVNLAVWQAVSGKENAFMMTGMRSADDTEAAPQSNMLWPSVAGNTVCLYPVGSRGDRSIYAVPTERNGKRCDIIILFSPRYPEGKILGTRQEDGFIIQKGCDKLEHGDKLSFYYRERYFANNQEADNNSRWSGDWIKSAEFTVDGELGIDWVNINGEDLYYGLIMTDIYNEEFFTEPERILGGER